jgi:hypothetical protein
MILITITSLAILTGLMIFSKLRNKSLAPLYSFGFVLLVSLGTAMCSSPTENVADGEEIVVADSTKKCCKKDSTKKCCKSDSTKKCCKNKCDMSKCATMTKEECANMCDEKGCSAEEKARCLAHYDEDGNWKGCKEDKSCCKVKCCKKGDVKSCKSDSTKTADNAVKKCCGGKSEKCCKGKDHDHDHSDEDGHEH